MLAGVVLMPLTETQSQGTTGQQESSVKVVSIEIMGMDGERAILTDISEGN